MQFEDDTSGNVLHLCVEHMDGIVTAALERHKEELLQKRELWYEFPDDAEQIALDKIDQEAEEWQTG
jgi:hypothetical protein